MTNLERATLVVVIVFACVTAVMLTGCAPARVPVPPFVTEEKPVLPAECFAAAPTIPLLPEDRDADARLAGRDSAALTDALRIEGHNRRTCRARLEVLFPGQAPVAAASAKR